MKWGRIEFIDEHFNRHCFYSYVNRMTMDRLSGFDIKPPVINSIGWVNSVFKDIWEKADVLAWGGTLATPPKKK